ncbi:MULTISPECIES: hypothetical protein [unclassified Ruegeria]|uniref:hypothetical protein n=1 Tax=unclassified Ruegeria TaxID=2625375 RepID=UPI0014877195|nr:MULTISPECIES: hypothetical protein [unclassified Ruegeria]NOD37087.1 hypothetical protein [Ruegeria sp. HKCCD7296]NOE44249.1 hypothetical protein [Ruegeria sp. HKCCD7319]
MKRLIVHIGWEKTGTTSLQAFMSNNCDKLENVGVHYPNDRHLTFVQGNGHFPLAGALTNQNKQREFIAEHKKIDGQVILSDFASHLKVVNKTTVISCEHLSSRVGSENEIKLLKDSIDATGYEVKVVCYIRDPVSLAKSSHSTAVKVSKRDKLNWDRVDPQNEYFNPVHRLRRWAEVFGKENVTVREYLPSKLVGGDICSDFCELIGVDSQDFAIPDRLNTALSLDHLEILRRCNFFLPTPAEDMASWRKSNTTRAILRKVRPDRENVELSHPIPVGVLDRFSKACDEIESEFLPEGLSENWRRTKQPLENESDKDLPETASELESLSAEWLVCLAKKTQELQQERDKAISERDKAISERDQARRHPWVYFKHAAKLRFRQK